MAILPSQLNLRTECSNRGDTLKVALAFATIYLVWGSTYLAIHYAVATIPPLLAAGVRSLIAGAILLGWAWARGLRPKREHWFAGAVLGALLFLASHGLLNWGEQRVASGLAALAIALEPMFIVILGWMARQHRVTGSVAVGLLLGASGVALLADFTDKPSELEGLGAVVLAALSWSVGVVIQPRLRLPADALLRTAIPSLCGAGMLFIAAAISGEFTVCKCRRLPLARSSGSPISSSLARSWRLPPTCGSCSAPRRPWSPRMAMSTPSSPCFSAGWCPPSR